MKFREHRGGLDESMKTVVEVNDITELEKHVLGFLYKWGVDSIRLKFTEYLKGGDPRIGWKELYIITDPDWGVVGWADGIFPEEKQ